MSTTVALFRELFTRPKKGDNRSPERLRAHYDVETELANRLRNAPKQQRTALYATLYDELYNRVPDHPQLTRKIYPESRRAAIVAQVVVLQPFLKQNCIFLEIGPGDCALSCEVAKQVRKVYGVDVSEEITKRINMPDNFSLVLSDGSNIPLPKGLVDVAYSNQLIEHLHPEDALDQLRNIFEVLTSGGVYVCCTPSRLGGPWDISMHFDPVAKGFHMKEYTYGDLYKLFRHVGFRKIKALVGARGRYIQVPALVMCGLEAILKVLPYRSIAGFFPFRLMLDIRLAGVK